ncbi:EamA family transporter [Agrobacterium vitis]|uniref:DMT family transporter n=1 Tax=Rhizobium/Agrobacterium group TaxID=227290 RepID=UPI0008DC1A4A|nr:MULTISPECIES: DMT family transporter [Rhizobium/Agrobacterium group]MCF1433350.1 DMT family transporter [Allorhizobium ampelinum]MUO91341.1 EamA family transporter [Agrobacterium vitis]MUZ54554.1 EamA family transporter [Agrobacterium vitis]MUZ93187.1 EamA family transporter [Agrobacterium vitis]MVA41290.1 EamA family transporter [Agrobacterium vitis]
MNKTTSGLINGFLGMLIFSGSLPATRAAIGSFDPVFLTVARASIAGLLGCGLLLVFRPAKPNLAEIAALAMVSLCVVIGFPLLTAYALQHIPSARSLVFIALLPLSTALFAVLRGGERPRPIFWLFSSLGSALVIGFALSQGAATASYGDMLMILAILICGLGYAEGARLSRRLGGWQVICWALTLALPVSVVAAAFTLPSTLSGVTAGAWLGLGYVSLFSMLIGFIFWYRGLAQGGIAAIGQLQLLQPFFGLALAAALLHEAVSASMLVTTLAVVACVTGARRATL